MHEKKNPCNIKDIHSIKYTHLSAVMRAFDLLPDKKIYVHHLKANGCREDLD